jgi:hypothetical protein
MIELQYQTMIGAARQTIPKEVLERPDLIEARSDFRKIEAIEAELVNEISNDIARRLLEPFFHKDPWLRARAAVAFYRINQAAALA